jgi:hypothetical protein
MVREILRICKERAIEYPLSKRGGGIISTSTTWSKRDSKKNLG